MTEITKPLMLDETGQRIAAALENMGNGNGAGVDIEAPKPRATIKNIRFFDKEAHKWITFESVYSAYDVTKKQTTFVYGLEKHQENSTTQAVYRSCDGGETWEKFNAPFAIDAPNYVWYSEIFVDSNPDSYTDAKPEGNPVLFLLKTTDGYTRQNNQLCTFTWNGSSWYQTSSLELGNKRWLSNNNSIDVCVTPDGKDRVYIFGEYGMTTDGSSYSIYRSPSWPIEWKKVLTHTGRDSSEHGDIMHWHTVVADPYTKHWWATSGDLDRQCRMYRSTDGGVNWELMFSGSQRERTCNLLFEEDYIYYGMDSTNNTDLESVKIVRIDKHKLETAEDRATAQEDVATIKNALACYGLSKMEFPHGFIVWTQHEPPVGDVATSIHIDQYVLQFYDYATQKLYPIATFDTSKIKDDKYIGFYAGSRVMNASSGYVFVEPTPALHQERDNSYARTSEAVRISVSY